MTVAGTTYTIPAKTPFYLEAQATDVDAQDAGNLTYSWEQINVGAANPSIDDDGTRPLFRSYLPVASNRRYFPSLQFVLAGTNNPPDLYSAAANGGGEGATETKQYRVGEVLPATDRTIRFRVSVRDNRKADTSSAGTIGFADVSVRSVAAAGPFQVTKPNGGESLPGGTSQSVTGNVAGTSTSPIGTSFVRISFSTDSGKTFSEILADNVANSGSATVTLPGSTTTKARIRVEAAGNIYDISDADFTITPADPSQLLISAVLNAASFQPTLAPNTFFTIFGNNLGTKETVASGLSATAEGAGVTVCGATAMLTSNSGPGSIDGIIPPDAAGNELPCGGYGRGQEFAGVCDCNRHAGPGDFPVHQRNVAIAGGNTCQRYGDWPGSGRSFPCTGWRNGGVMVHRRNPGATNPAISIGGLNAAIAYYGSSGGVTGLCQINAVVRRACLPAPIT